MSTHLNTMITYLNTMTSYLNTMITYLNTMITYLNTMITYLNTMITYLNFAFTWSFWAETTKMKISKELSKGKSFQGDKGRTSKSWPNFFNIVLSNVVFVRAVPNCPHYIEYNLISKDF